MVNKVSILFRSLFAWIVMAVTASAGEPIVFPEGAELKVALLQAREFLIRYIANQSPAETPPRNEEARLVDSIWILQKSDEPQADSELVVRFLGSARFSIASNAASTYSQLMQQRIKHEGNLKVLPARLEEIWNVKHYPYGGQSLFIELATRNVSGWSKETEEWISSVNAKVKLPDAPLNPSNEIPNRANGLIEGIAVGLSLLKTNSQTTPGFVYTTLRRLLDHYAGAARVDLERLLIARGLVTSFEIDSMRLLSAAPIVESPPASPFSVLYQPFWLLILLIICVVVLWIRRLCVHSGKK